MKLHQVRAWADSHADVALDLIRIYLGLGLIAKGLFFVAHRENLIQLMENSGSLWFAPALMAHYIIIAHVVGGFMLAIGLLTRIAALVQLPILIGAVFWIHMPRLVSLGARDDVEFSTLVLFLLAVITFYGAGRWSLDAWLTKRMPVEIPAPRTA